MKEKRILGLGARLLFFIVPVSIGSLLVSGYITGTFANRGVEKAMTRLMVYKAEDLMRYTDSQWELLLDNNLQADQAYLESLRKAVASYALTMLRSEGEWIFAVDDNGNLVFSVGADSGDSLALESAGSLDPGNGGDLLVSGFFAGEDRVGFAFNIPALGWDIYITDLRETYFADSRLLRMNTIILVGITVLAGALFVVFFIRRSLKPLKIVVADMHRIVEDRDFGSRVDPMQNDEVGELAKEFNLMSDYLDRAINRLKDAVNQEAEARIEIRNRERETLEVLARFSDHKDTETAKHTSRVGIYASYLSSLRGDSADETDLMRWAAPLHDIGKVGIPDEVLLKDAGLTAAQRKVMESHVSIGWEILKNSSSPVLRAGADIALSHHERWNGSGYPSGLKGNKIPYRGRITGLVDVFDALTTERPYKEAWPLDKALEWIRNEAGVQFDPELVELFFADLEPLKQIMDTYSDDDPKDIKESALS